MVRERVVYVTAAACLLFAAGLFWSRFLSQDVPFVYHPDEPAIVARALRMVETGDPNPRWFRYPSLVLYLQAATAAAVHAVTGRPVAPGTEILFEGARAAAVPYYVAGRGVTLAFAVLTTIVTVLLSRRLAGRWIGLLAGAAFAASPLALSSAVYVTVDMPLTFFVAGATLLCARAAGTEGSPRPALFAAAVACAALGAGAKYNGAVVLLPIAGAFLLRRGPGKRSAAALCALAIFAVVVFVATTPYAVLDPDRFWSTGDGWLAELVHYRSGHLGHDDASSLAKALQVGFHALGWLAPFAVLGVAALFVLPRSDARVHAGWLVLGVLAVLAIPVATARVFFERNCLPFLPLLLALSALGLRAVLDFVRDRGLPPKLRAAVIALVATALALEAHRAYDALEWVVVHREADPRTIAHRWAVTHVPPGSRILREAFTPHLHLEGAFVVDSVFAVGHLPSIDAMGDHDYVVTSHMWRNFPDIGATPYQALFERPPVFQSGRIEDFVVRIHRLAEARP